MLSKVYRMKQNAQFNYTFKKGEAFKSKYLVLIVAHSKITEPKIGLVVSKKLGNSVLRNRIKRLLRETVNSKLLQIKKNLNIVLVAKSGIENLNFNQINSLVEDLLKKSNAIM